MTLFKIEKEEKRIIRDEPYRANETDLARRGYYRDPITGFAVAELSDEARKVARGYYTEDPNSPNLKEKMHGPFLLFVPREEAYEHLWQVATLDGTETPKFLQGKFNGLQYCMDKVDTYLQDNSEIA